MRERKKSDHSYKTKISHVGEGGLYRRDPPDWKGRFPAFETPEQKAQRTAAELEKQKRQSMTPDIESDTIVVKHISGEPQRIQLPAPGIISESTTSKPTSHENKNAAKAHKQPLSDKRERKNRPVKPKFSIGGHRGMYRKDPPDWKGRFPAFEKQKIFPFLNLPTELRAEIYSLLLGGRTIHIDYPGSKDPKRFIDGHPFLCSASITDAKAFAQHGWEPKTLPPKFFFAIRHSSCTASVAQALPLSVIGLCKQVYKETSLVPFQENCFTFSSPYSITNFLRRLNALQQRALTHVAVFQTSAGTMWDADLKEPLKLPPYLNIKKLTIFIEICPANLSPKDGRMAITNVDVQDRLVSRMSVLWSPKLQKVEVLINNSSKTGSDSAKSMSKEDVKAWTERIRRALLPGGDAVDGDDEPVRTELQFMDEELDALVSDSE